MNTITLPVRDSDSLERETARQKAIDKMWPLLGFRLRDELTQPVLTEADALADLNGTPRPECGAR